MNIYDITPHIVKLPEEVQLENVAIRRQNKLLWTLLALSTACLIFMVYKEYKAEQDKFI